jgi:hypothetical protein
MPPPAATQAAARLWTQLTPPLPVPRSYSTSVEITKTLWWQTRFTRGRVGEWKSGSNSVTFQNRTHVYMKFSDHKDLGNHLLQLCPKVVKHHVCLCVCVYIFVLQETVNIDSVQHTKMLVFNTSQWWLSLPLCIILRSSFLLLEL